MAFPARFKTFAPEGYADLSFQIRVNPTNAELMTLVRGSVPETADNEDAKAREKAKAQARATFGKALMQAYAGAKVEAYGVLFDFSTPDAALATMELDGIPDDLAHWLRNAPVDVVLAEREAITKNYRAS